MVDTEQVCRGGEKGSKLFLASGVRASVNPPQALAGEEASDVEVPLVASL